MKIVLRTFMVSIAVATLLVGCGSSSMEEQLDWITKWNSPINYEEQLTMLNQCIKEAGIRSIMEELSSKQRQVLDDCELNYILVQAEQEGVVLDEDVILDNIIML